MDARTRWARARLEKGVCPACGYQTAGLAGVATCPECGDDWTRWTGEPRSRTPDPGSRRAGLIATILAFVLIIVVAVLQQTSESAAAKAAGSPPAAEQAKQDAEGTSAQFETIAKAGVKYFFFSRGQARDDTQSRRLADSIVSFLDREAETDSDRLRVAIVAGEILDKEAALGRLVALLQDRQPDPSLKDDAAAVTAVLYDRSTVEQRDALAKRYGWFGRLAATHGLSENDPRRDQVVGGGATLAAMLFLVAALAVAVGIASLVLFITGIVLAASGSLRPHFDRPAPGGSVAAETVVVFVTCFIALKLLTGVVERVSGSALTAVIFAMVLQWSLIAVLFWPVARGVRARETMRLWGLKADRGVLREVALGVVGYVALLPLVVGGAAVSYALMAAYQRIRAGMGYHEAPVPNNPILEIVSGKASPWLVLLLGLLASLWAPLVEEAIFRGALYRQLRSWWHWLPAGLVTALCFGLMHGYPLLLLGPVIALGFGFALLREWRGSVIASMTAHCVHNTLVITLLLTVMRLIG